MEHDFFLSQLNPTLLVLLLTYLASLLLLLIAFVPGAGENLVRFLVGLKQVVRLENKPSKGKIGTDLIFAFRKFFRDTKIPLVIKVIFLLAVLLFIFGKFFIKL